MNCSAARPVHASAIDATTTHRHAADKDIFGDRQIESSRISWWMRPIPAESASAGASGAKGSPRQVIMPTVADEVRK